MNLLACDPSITCAGMALFDIECKDLWAADHAVRPSKISSDPAGWHWMAKQVFEWRELKALSVSTVAIEYPQIYSAGKGKGDPNDMFPVACVAQSLAAMVLERGAQDAKIIRYLPHDWKGSRGKIANTVDIRKRLSQEEFDKIVVPESTCEHCRQQFPKETCVRIQRRANAEPCKIHNTYDAIGIGLKALGRFERNRVVPR